MKSMSFYYRLISQTRHKEGINYSFYVLLFRMIYWLLKYRTGITAFFMLSLHKKGYKIRSVLSNKEFFHIHDKLNPAYYRSILEDKYVFDRFMRSFGFPMVEIKGLIENNMIKWLDNNAIESIDNLINYHLNCFVKMHSSWGGSQVYKLEILDKKININTRPSYLEDVRNRLAGNLYILQDTIVQHSELDRLNPSCVNTLRMVTIHNGQHAENLSNFLRIGIAGSLVDNLSKGGLGCAVQNDGKLFSTASDKDGINRWITHHPDTHVAFNQFKIPFYKEALDFVRKMHEVFHCFFIIAWDIVITNNGPVLLEANPLGEVIQLQTICGGIRDQFYQYAKAYEKAKSSFLSR